MKSQVFFLYALFILFNGNLANAQQMQIKLKGQVYERDQTPIAYVTVSLLTLDSIHVQQISTDENGAFSMNTAKGTYLLILSQVGNELYSRSIELNGNLDLGIIEVDGSIALQAVTINAALPLIQTVGDKLYFNIENSPLGVGNDGLEVLKKSPKVSVGSEGKLLLKNKSALVLLNGRKINLQGKELDDFLSNITSEDIKRIEIQDLASSEQDASSDGGTINIVLKTRQTGFRAVAKANYFYRNKDYSKYGGGLNLNLGRKKWNAYTDISINTNNDFANTKSQFNYSDGRSNEEIGWFTQKYNSIGTRLGVIYYPDQRNELGIEGYINRNEMDIFLFGELDVNNPSENTVRSISNSVSRSSTNIWYMTFNYILKTDTLGSMFKIISDIGNNFTDPFNDVSIFYPSFPNRNNHYIYDNRADSRYYTTQADWIQKLKDNWQIESGAKFSRIERDNRLAVRFLEEQEWKDDENQMQNFDNRENTIAGYLTGEKLLGKNYIKLGLRIEHTNIKGNNIVNDNRIASNYTKFFPSVFYQFNLSNDRHISLSYKRSISRPSFADLNPFVLKINDYLYHIGNPYLQPLFINRIDLAYNFHKHSISLYGMEIDQLIHKVYFVDQNNINYFQAQNFGTYRSIGVDHTYNKNLDKWLYLSISTGVYYNSFKGQNISRFGGASFYNNSYLQIKPYKTYLLELSSNYQHAYREVNIESRYRYQIDITATKQFKDNLLFKLAVLDVFNSRFDENTSFFPDFNFNFYQKRMTRGIFLQVQYTFNNKGKVKQRNVESDNDGRTRL